MFKCQLGAHWSTRLFEVNALFNEVLSDVDLFQKLLYFSRLFTIFSHFGVAHNYLITYSNSIFFLLITISEFVIIFQIVCVRTQILAGIDSIFRNTIFLKVLFCADFEFAYLISCASINRSNYLCLKLNILLKLLVVNLQLVHET